MTNSHDNEARDPITVADIKEIAKKRLDKPVWDYYITGADEEYTVRRNESIFQE